LVIDFAGRSRIELRKYEIKIHEIKAENIRGRPEIPFRFRKQDSHYPRCRNPDRLKRGVAGLTRAFRGITKRIGSTGT
jgi:hypothetical protein